MYSNVYSHTDLHAQAHTRTHTHKHTNTHTQTNLYAYTLVHVSFITHLYMYRLYAGTLTPECRRNLAGVVNIHMRPVPPKIVLVLHNQRLSILMYAYTIDGV